MTPENIFGCSYLAGFALLAFVGIRLSHNFRQHMQTYHPAKWDGMVRSNFPANNSFQAVIAARNERGWAIKLFLKRKDYLALNDPQLVKICRRMKVLNLVGVGYVAFALIGWMLMMQSRSNARTQSELKRARAEVAAAVADHVESQDRGVAARQDLAQVLAAHGDDPEALEEYLWLYDDGMKHVTAYSGVRESFLLSDIKKLGDKYPTALAALRKRRDDAEKRLAASKYGAEDGKDFSSINWILGDSTTTLKFFDSLPPGDSRRHVFGFHVIEELLKARRYAEAAELRPTKQVLAMLNEGAKCAWAPHAEGDQSLRQFYMGNAAEGLEALAGSGKIDDARKVIRRMLAIDDSPWVRAILLKHLERAGQGMLLDPAPAPVSINQERAGGPTRNGAQQK